MGKAVSAIFIFVFFGALLIGLHYSIYYLLVRQGKLNLSSIIVEGNQLLPSKNIIEASALSLGIGIFDFDLSTAANNVKKSFLIENAEIFRFPPDKVLIKVTERIPTAVIIDGMKNSYVCDKNGTILAKGFMSRLPILLLDYNIPKEDSIKDDFLLILIANLSKFEQKNEIRQIYIKRKEGIYITMKGLDSTLFYLGKSIPDKELFNKMLSIAAKIKQKDIKIKYIDMNRESAIGYQ